MPSAPCCSHTADGGWTVVMNQVKHRSRQVAVGIVGGFVLLLGVITIPYPGPGWLIVFSGLAILSMEFTWAKKMLLYGRAKYDAWKQWLQKQHYGVKVAVLLLTCAVVIVTIWLLNGYGFINQWLGLGFEWVESPLPVPGK